MQAAPMIFSRWASEAAPGARLALISGIASRRSPAGSVGRAASGVRRVNGVARRSGLRCASGLPRRSPARRPGGLEPFIAG
jgi:hypothetical protein